jgi:uncharacterized protein (DUF4415 family)
VSETHIIRRSRHERPAAKADWQRVDRLTDEDIRRAAASDPDAAPLLDPSWFETAELVLPGKKLISIRLDKDVLDYFRASGRHYQTRINAVLKAYVTAQRRSDDTTSR